MKEAAGEVRSGTGQYAEPRSAVPNGEMVPGLRPADGA